MSNNNNDVVVVVEVGTRWVVILTSEDKINYRQKVGEYAGVYNTIMGKYGG